MTARKKGSKQQETGPEAEEASEETSEQLHKFIESRIEDPSEADPVKLYLREIRQTALLTPEEEIELSKQIHAGSEEARDRMIKANLRLVVSIARRYLYLGLPLLDLVEEGNLGLIKAVEKYDWAKGYRFSTYASWWIRQSITRALANQGKLIRVPIYMTELINRWKRVSQELTQKLGRNPTNDEVAKAMDVPVDKVKEIREMSRIPASLDMPLSEYGVGQLIDLLHLNEHRNGTSEVDRFIQHERVMHLVSMLSQRESDTLRLRFGLEDGLQRTLEETGRELGLTRERVRQIEATAIRKLQELTTREGDLH